MFQEPQRAARVHLLPSTPQQIAEVARNCRRMVRRQALLGAGAGLLPLPGLDLAADVGLMMRLLQRIDHEFGLSERQLDRLDARQKVAVYQALLAMSGAMVGKLLSKELVLQALQSVGTRTVLVKQGAKLVPLAGHALSAALGFGAMCLVGEKHIRDCMRVLEQVMPPQPWPHAERLDG